METKDRVNWGVISCARIADGAVIPGIKASSNGRLYAISGKTESKLRDFEKRHNPQKAYDSYEALLADPNVDAVYIPLPNSMHLEWVVKAAESGKHILCEKPLSLTVEQVKEMQAACEKNGVLLMEAFAYRHNPAIIKVKELLDQGVIGKPALIEGHFSFLPGDENDIRLQKDLGGGSLYDVGSYPINLFRYLTGKQPEEICAQAMMHPKTGVDTNACVVYSYGDGLLGMIHCSFDAVFMNGFTIAGDKGIIEYPGLYHATGHIPIRILRQDPVVQPMQQEEIVRVNCQDNYMLEVEQFGRCILNGEKPRLSLEETMDNLATIKRIHELIGY